MPPATTVYVVAGRKAAQWVARTKRELVAEFSFKDSPQFAEARAISKFAQELFLSGQVDAVDVVFTNYINTLTQKAEVRPLLPMGRIQKLEANQNAFGIFGYSFLEENAAKLRGVALDGVEPTFENIAGGKYKGARPLFVYVKKQHVGVIPGLDKFVAEFVSAKATGEDGYLSKKGLVALPKAEGDKVRAAATQLQPVAVEQLTN